MFGHSSSRSLRMIGAAVAGATAAGLAVGYGGNIGSARADAGGTPVNVSAFGCIGVRGGHRSVPAGSMIVIRSGWASTKIGGVHAFLNAQASLLSVQDGPMLDVSDLHGAPEPTGAGQVVNGWVSFVTYPTGVTLANPGDAMRFTFALLLDNPIADPSDLDSDGKLDTSPVSAGLVFGGTCTVTAASGGST